MKIIYLANARIPTEKGHGWQISKMCEAFAAQGQEVLLLLPWRLNPIKETLFSFYQIKPIFKIKKLPCFDQAFFSFISDRLAFLLQTASFLLAAKIYLIFKKFDVLYTREAAAGLFFKDHIFEIHFLPKQITGVARKTWQNAGRLVTITKGLAQELTGQGVAESKILAAPDGVDLREFDLQISKQEARQKLGLPLDKKIVLYTGSFFLYGWKGVDTLLAAAKLFKDDKLFVFVGGREEEITDIEKKRVSDNILLISYRPHAEIPFYLKAADVLVLPNKSGDKMSEKYTSPLKLFEYMVSRRPVVASDLPSIREILNENNAVLFESNSPEKLAKSIEKILAEPDLAEKITQQSYLDAQNYTWEKRAKNILNFQLYEKS